MTSSGRGVRLLRCVVRSIDPPCEPGTAGCSSIRPWKQARRFRSFGLGQALAGENLSRPRHCQAFEVKSLRNSLWRLFVFLSNSRLSAADVSFDRARRVRDWISWYRWWNRSSSENSGKRCTVRRWRVVDSIPRSAPAVTRRLIEVFEDIHRPQLKTGYRVNSAVHDQAEPVAAHVSPLIGHPPACTR